MEETVHKNYFIDVRFEIQAPSDDLAMTWLIQELRSLNDSDIIEYWTVRAVIEESALDEDDED